MHQVTELAHHRLFDALANARSAVTLTSPFLGPHVAFDLADLAAESSASWRLLTTLDPRAAADGFLSVPGLEALVESGIEVRDLPGLHAKTYLVDDDFGLVGSANLTDTGLGRAGRPNTELSAVLDRAGIRHARKSVDHWWHAASPVDGQVLADFVETVERLPRLIRSEPDASSPGRLDAGELEQLLSDVRDPDRGLWIKAQSLHDELAPWRSPHWFSNHGSSGRPQITTGDIVAIYSTPHSGLIAIVEVTSESRNDPDFVRSKRRWSAEESVRHPWVNETRPRLVPDTLTVVSPSDIGVKTGGLQNGRIRAEPHELIAAIRALYDSHA